MKKGLLGKKIGMMQIFENDLTIPVTVIEAGPCMVTQIKTDNTDGYNAMQIGFWEVKENYLNKPLHVMFEKIKQKPLKYLREVRLGKEEVKNYEIGQEIKVEIFSEGEKVDISGISKGKGFAGPVKRWGFRGFPRSHGSRYHRAAGSIGASATPSRVFKGKKMPGQLGNEKVTQQNLEIVKVLLDKNLLLIKGATPGSNGGILYIKSSVKQKGK
ncbi:MAG: 50S ribosomal protein L3 [Actinomycetia bacterium]|nr:50S ribosomal protein L3 [Actinomycetes bacterium]